ncbi:hypothetical protein [Pseudanabaena yagii]|uniref:Uncharacterized protein n=1 Tax=Pseudanabaena yagii GIHE-NHR1 TaxID=2722753 RepID=A0ABX1LYB4_9CYAN|nr:hypothetical protein [Pseudanabaena yagii]NMF61174.1 hypothetical protein [Pseudanabaena yagii GIHE-NHR1]
MISLNNQYSSRKFSPTKSNNPCPICDDITGKCRTASDNQDFVLCMTHPSDADLPDWKYLGETNGGYFAGKYVRKRLESELDRQERRTKNLRLRLAQQKAKRDGLAKLPDTTQRDRLYQNYLQKLDLDSLDRADLVSRGLSEFEIKYLGAKSTNSGYILPIKNPLGQILGFQIRLRDADSGRYRWHKPFGISAQQQNGELPLAFQGDIQDDHQRVVLVEGTGVKPYLASKLRGCVAIGASGGQFVASKETLQSYFDAIGAKPELTRLEYAIDAGDIANSSVMRRHEKNLDFLAELDFAVDILWWGQFAKTDDDIDELSSREGIQLLTVEQFFQIANYQPKTKLSPLQWLSDKLFPKSKSKSDVKRSPDTAPDYEYASGERLTSWQNSLRSHKHVLDASATGTGKSHDAGSLRPEMFGDGIEKIIYIYGDSRNVSTTTLQDWQLLPARHNGLTNKKGKLRLAQQGEALTTRANCSRTGAIAALKKKGISDTQIICETCPLLKACRGSSGDGFGFRHERAIAFNSKILRSHPMSLPNPDQYDYSKTLLIWEEVSESLSMMRQISVDADDVDKVIAKISRTNLENKHQIIDLLNKLHDLLADKSKYGLNFQKIKTELLELISEVGDLTLLADVLQPDLSILDTVNGIADSEFEQVKGKDKRELSRLNALLKQETTLGFTEIEQMVNRDVLKQWLPEFLDILVGKIQHGALHIHRGKLTVSLLDARLRDIAQRSAANLYLDATINVADLKMRLAADVHLVKQSGILPMPTIFQVTDIGRMTMQRGAEQQRKAEAIATHLKTIDPSTMVIDFKKFADNADGIWFRDSRGSNDFATAKTFVVTGTPCPNIAALKSEYAVLTGLHPDEDDPAFAEFVDRRILANVQQCFGRKSGHRFQDGDQIYFLADFDLGQIPHTKIVASDITPEAMSKLEILKSQITQLVQDALAKGIDLLSMSQRQKADWLGIKWGQFRRNFEWIDPLLNFLYSNTIQNLTENIDLVNTRSLDSNDQDLVEFWSGATEKLLADNASIQSTLAGIIEFFNSYIPQYLHHFVVAKLSLIAHNRLFSTLATFIP